MLDAYTMMLIGISAAFIAILIAVVVFMGYLRKILSIASFMGPNATIFAIGSKYTEIENMEKILEMSSVAEVINDIKKEGYTIENAENADVEIEKKMIEMMNEVIAMLPEGTQEFAESYMLKYDAQVIKRILRAKAVGVPKEKIYETIYSCKHISDIVINHMVEATNIDDSISALDATPFSRVIEIWNEKNSLHAVDTAIDAIVLEKLIEEKSKLDEDSMEAINKIMGIMIDVYNLKVLIRGKLMRINVEKYLVNEGYEIDSWKIKTLGESRSMEELLGNLEGTSYAEIRDAKDAFESELILDRILLNKAIELGMVYSTSSGPTMMFLISKEYEARNLKAIIKGFQENLDKDRIWKLLVGVAS